MTKEETIKVAEKRLSLTSYRLEMDSAGKSGLRKIHENEYDFLSAVLSALRAQQKLLEMLELDRDAWKLCDGCRANRFFGNRFCCRCGRPLTEEAWAELERRIGGNDGTTD